MSFFVIDMQIYPFLLVCLCYNICTVLLFYSVDVPVVDTVFKNTEIKKKSMMKAKLYKNGVMHKLFLYFSRLHCKIKSKIKGEGTLGYLNLL